MSKKAFIVSRLVYDPTEEPLEDVVIHTDGDRVSEISDRAGKASVVDLRPYTIIPGLIDAHVHLTWSGNATPNEISNQEKDEMSLLRGVANARTQLYAGTTTVRDLGSRGGLALHLARAQQLGLIEGPHIIASGNVIAMTGGHAAYLGVQVDGPWSVTGAVRAELTNGAGVIKVMASEGLFGKDEDPRIAEFEVEELQAAVRAAHRAGKTVAAHAYGPSGIDNSIAARVDSIEHGAFLSDAQALQMAELGIALVPTLSTYHGYSHHGHELGFSEHMLTTADEVLERAQNAVRSAQRAGVTIAAGTDAGVPGQPHGSLATELELLCAAGLTPQEALQAGTTSAAAAIDQSGNRGKVQVGMIADFVAVIGNPQLDISSVRNVQAVVQGGRHYPAGSHPEMRKARNC